MINLALIGCGYWGKNYVNTISNLDNIKLNYIVDLKKPSIKIPEGVIYTSNYIDVLKNNSIESLIIATPTQNHYDTAKKAFEHDKNVLIEKPLTNNSAKAEELCELAEKKKKILMVGHTFEYNNALEEVKKRIKDGEIGEIIYIDSKRVGLGPIRKDVSVSWDFATHDIYISNFLFGKKPIAVSCLGISRNNKVEDIANINMLYENPKAISSIYVNWLHPEKIRQTIIGGEKKAISFNDVEVSEKIKIFDRSIEFLPLKSGDFGEFQTITREGNIIIPKLKLRAPLENQLIHFAECIERKIKCKTDGYKGLEIVKILEACDESKKRGGILIDLK